MFAPPGVFLCEGPLGTLLTLPRHQTLAFKMVAQKASSKAGRTPMETRRSKSKALKEEGTPTPSTRSTGKKRGSNRSNQSFTHHLPTDEQKKCNGRVQGRSLIVWGSTSLSHHTSSKNRCLTSLGPRMAEKLLLHIQYECQRARIDLPWNSIAHRLHPGSSGAAIGQHLNRLRRELIAEGHMVPPLPQSRGGGTVDSSIRGYVRLDMEGTDKETTRPVSFSEKLEDRRYNLVDAFDLDMSDTPAMVTEAREEDPFVDSPAFKRSSHTFGSTRQTPMGAYSSFCSTDNAEPIDQFLHGPVLGSATIVSIPYPASEQFLTDKGRVPWAEGVRRHAEFQPCCFGICSI